MDPMPKPELILASRSPRREQILAMLGFAFAIQVPDYEEINPPGMDPRRVPEHLARGKAEAMTDAPPGALVLSADTVVILGDRILGKPRDPAEAPSMPAPMRWLPEWRWRATGRWKPPDPN
jgi:septum formation protein